MPGEHVFLLIGIGSIIIRSLGILTASTIALRDVVLAELADRLGVGRGVLLDAVELRAIHTSSAAVAHRTRLYELVIGCQAGYIIATLEDDSGLGGLPSPLSFPVVDILNLI